MKTCSESILPLHSTDPSYASSFTDSDISPVSPNNLPHIHRLPVELLQRLFLLIVNDIQDCPSIFSFGDTTISANFASPPLLFTHVCRLWRVVAHSTSGVWSRIQVGLPARPLKPFLTSLLQFWLANSGNRPLTLRIVSTQQRGPFTLAFMEGHSQLLKILLAEKERWETVAITPQLLDRYENLNFDTPRLSTLECSWWDMEKFKAPHLCRLLVMDSYLHVNVKSIPTCKNIRHLHLRCASVDTMRCILEYFSNLESIAVDRLLSTTGRGGPITAIHSCLESLTLSLHSDRHSHGMFIDLFDGLHLPMLQKLTVVGKPHKPQVDCIVVALEISSCRVEVLDFQTDTPASEIDFDIVKPLFSAVREVTLRGESAGLSYPLQLHM